MAHRTLLEQIVLNVILLSQIREIINCVKGLPRSKGTPVLGLASLEGSPIANKENGTG